jgi:hypothetical protein
MQSHARGCPRLRIGTWVASVLMLIVAAAFCLSLPTAQASGSDRAYELVSPSETNGVVPGYATPAPSGEVVNYEGQPFGDAGTGGENLYQARRTSGGWQSKALTPAGVVPAKPFAQTPPMFFTRELTQTIFLTEQPFAGADKDGGAQDLYQQSSGALEWISHGSLGGTAPSSATFEGATPDGTHVAFDSSESLVPAATGLEESPYSKIQYLYLRDVATGETQLVNANDEGKLLNTQGAALGNGNYVTTGEPPVNQFLTADYYGSTIHAISNDGSKIFFESPVPEESETELRRSGSSPTVHLYMRKDNSLTVPLDNTQAEGRGSRFIGASEDGRYVFFISEEGLAGDSFTDNELYVYDTSTEKLTAISAAPEGSPAVDGAVIGVTALANDGSHVYYVAKGVLAANENSHGQKATEGGQNLYIYDTSTGQNKFVTELGTAEAEPEPERTARLDNYLLPEHQAVPTPNGEVLVFLSQRNLTGEDPGGVVDIYRYDNATDQLICISCGPNSTGNSLLGIHAGPGPGGIGGGTYDPPGESSSMSEDGEQIFFETTNTLVPEDRNGNSPPATFGNPPYEIKIPTNGDVYEWSHGTISLISGGRPGYTGLEAVTPSANDVFFGTSVALTSQSTGGYGALYDARVGGGFPNVEATPVGTCEDTEGCRGSSANPVFPPPSSSYLQNAITPVLATKPAVKPAVKQKKKRKVKHKRARKTAKVHKRKINGRRPVHHNRRVSR